MPEGVMAADATLELARIIDDNRRQIQQALDSHERLAVANARELRAVIAEMQRMMQTIDDRLAHIESTLAA